MQVSGDPRRPAEAHKYERPKINLEDQPPDMFLLMGLALGLLSLIFKVRSAACCGCAPTCFLAFTRTTPRTVGWWSWEQAGNVWGHSWSMCLQVCSPSLPPAAPRCSSVIVFSVPEAPERLPPSLPCPAPCRPSCRPGAPSRSACAAWPTPRAGSRTSSSLFPPSPLRCLDSSPPTCCRWGGDLTRQQQRQQPAHSSREAPACFELAKIYVLELKQAGERAFVARNCQARC